LPHIGRNLASIHLVDEMNARAVSATRLHAQWLMAEAYC
jgi:hypothetical protein